MSSRMYYSDDARNRAYFERSILAGVCLVFGLAIGTVIALLFAPSEGSDVRKQLVHKADEIRHEAEKRVEKLAK